MKNNKQRFIIIQKTSIRLANRAAVHQRSASLQHPTSPQLRASTPCWSSPSGTPWTSRVPAEGVSRLGSWGGSRTAWRWPAPRAARAWSWASSCRRRTTGPSCCVRRRTTWLRLIPLWSPVSRKVRSFWCFFFCFWKNWCSRGTFEFGWMWKCMYGIYLGYREMSWWFFKKHYIAIEY